ncbi:uncharacterized protein F5891DRAFT_1195634 [Suillus fuscotomentosus]|uniref:Uncharacterized protein n=1 Tax=Suillus fuscotomentosus TaxID=1912939 RepID=A0AAD4DUB6_9AGAM|nr:uncharacterized protein F5891DRAFT_1195634 [Suillus fuscotomentosus]KAG1894083.1 hypothetical protein F5891DRAFT_1195634 [Suillus fuscotomentosus]
MSSKTSPLLGSTIPAFEGLIQRWNLVVDLVPHCAPLVGIGLTWAVKYDGRMSLTDIYAVAMFIDHTRHPPWMNEHWTILRIAEAKNYILKLMWNKRTTNVSMQSDQSSSQLHPATLGSTIYGLPEINILPHHQGGPQSVVLSPTGTDLLSFWRHIFSSSGDTFTKKHNYLSPHLMEALQVVKFALKKERLHFTKGWAVSQRDMEYNLMCVIGSASREDLLASGGDLLTSAISGTTSGSHDHEALLRVIVEDKCDDVPDDIATTVPFILLLSLD